MTTILSHLSLLVTPAKAGVQLDFGGNGFLRVHRSPAPLNDYVHSSSIFQLDICPNFGYINVLNIVTKATV